ncbi:histidinol-phosphatase [Paenibacillus yanchengensis]|uniref:Histidinol-phosphatase n=1 Tax=Paenibacillus yanchengensis TaxID=2035833 RepID=A0ABW4YQ63_9BACL
MKFDLHTHHSRCGHATGDIEDYIKAAMEVGLQIIGISDHSPYFYHEKDHPFAQITMARSDFPNYVAEVLALKDKYKDKIEVLLGVESDYFPQHIASYQAAYKQIPFDYIIGSVHQVNGVSIFNRKRWNNLTKQQMIEEKKTYYTLIAESAQSGMFDILGHIDAMKGYFPDFSNIPANDAIDQTLRIIADQQIAIEINTSGKTKTVGGWYPSHDMLERAHHFGVQVTFGSDAHVPTRIADDFDEVREVLKAIGYKQWVFFRQRKRIAVPL